MAWLYVEYWLTVPDLEDVKISNEPQIEKIVPRESVGVIISSLIFYLFTIRQRRDS